MKKINQNFYTLFFFFFSIIALAQTDGISYQAVIYSPGATELPGYDSQNDILANHRVSFEFTITGLNNIKIYQETQTTTSDSNGLVNLVIGKGTPTIGLFNEIEWNGSLRILSVKLDVNGGNIYAPLSSQELLYLPLANHRNISASGNVAIEGSLQLEGEANLTDDINIDGDTSVSGLLTVDGGTVLNINTADNKNPNPRALTVSGNTLLGEELTVDGATIMNNSLEITNNSPVYMTGSLTTDGETIINNELTVVENTILESSLTVEGNTIIENSLRVEENTVLENTLTVSESSTFMSDLNVRGETAFSGRTVIDGSTEIGRDLDVYGMSDLWNSLTVNNFSPTRLTGTLDVDLDTNLNSDLIVDGTTVMNSSLDITNASPVNFTGTLNVDGVTDLNNNLIVDGSTTLNSSLDVTNTSPVNFTGTLNVDGVTDLNNNLIVDGSTTLNSSLAITNTSPVNFTGTLNVDGVTDLNNNLIVDGSTTLNSSLDVTNTSPVNFTGTLNVDGVTDLNNNLIVDGSTTLNSTLSTSGNTAVGGTLTVSGATQINNTLNATGNTNLGSALTVAGAAQINNTLSATGNTDLGNTLTVAGSTQLNSTLNVSNNTALSGTLTVANTADFSNRVTISAGFGSNSDNYNNYPLRVQGSANGIAVKVTAGTPNNDNNFMTFFDSGGTARGAIEGETAAEKVLDPEYLYELGVLTADVASAAANIGFAAIPTVVAGLGASAGPCASCIATAAAEAIVQAAHMAAFLAFSLTDLGVTYSSGSADYAEWLERLVASEQINSGDVIGIYNGKITKLITEDVQRVLVVSTNPAILGNTPAEKDKKEYEKVAFLGQVPVKVKGEVISGDYLIPSGDNLGYAIGIAKDEIKPNQYKYIIGIAWSSSVVNEYDFVKMAIGLNSNDLADLVSNQQNKIIALEKRIERIEKSLAQTSNETIKSDYSKTNQREDAPDLSDTPGEGNTTFYQFPYLTDDIIEYAMQVVRERFPIGKENPDFIEKLFNDQEYNKKIINQVKTLYREEYLKQSKKMEKDTSPHNQINKRNL